LDPHGGRTILIVDDEPMVRRVAAAMLDGAGYTILTAENGFRAVELIDEFAGEIDLVLCDVQMPGPSGLELRKIIASKRPQTKVVLLSGNVDPEGMPADVVVLAKPFSGVRLEQVVEQMLGR
jgi:CheY-like chemotaxis protein